MVFLLPAIPEMELAPIIHHSSGPINLNLALTALLRGVTFLPKHFFEANANGLVQPFSIFASSLPSGTGSRTRHGYVMLYNDVDWLLDTILIFAYPASIAENVAMNMKEALQQEDRAEFLKAMVKEIDDHTGRGHWRITTKDEMQKNNYTYRLIMAV
jgi:hypothetical protein